MAKKKVGVFVSFEFGKDNELHRGFYAHAKKHSRYDIRDLSLNERRPSKEWLKYAREQISKSDVVIVILGQDTHNAPGVEKEVTIANQLGKPMFQIRPQTRTSGTVKGVKKVIRWKWKRIDAEIDDILSKKRSGRRR